jgi:CubicO group peptidase (beta-lactamase class C family)
LADEFMAKNDIPGLSIAVSFRGRPVHVEAFGYADKENSEIATVKHRFRVASIAKPITAVGLFTLIEAGRVGLQSLVFGRDGILGEDYPSPARGGVVDKLTIEHLLTHTAGRWGTAPRDPMYLNSQMSHRQLIAWVLQNAAPIDEPGTNYVYSNIGYCILGRIIEKITGIPYEHFILETIARPCGIPDIRIAGNTAIDRAAQEVRYYGQGGDDPYSINVTRMDANGGWLATASEIVKFVDNIAGFGGADGLLSRSSLDVMTLPSVANPRYAKGFDVDGKGKWWHAGSLPGTSSIMVKAPTNFCWCGLANSRSNVAGPDGNLDGLLWRMVSSVPAWRAKLS